MQQSRYLNGMRMRGRSERYRSPVLNTKRQQRGKLHHRISPKQQKRDFSDLPQELVAKIGDSLSPKSLKTASSLCNLWHDALRPARKNMKYVEFITGKAMDLGNKYKNGRGCFRPANLNKALNMFLYAAEYGSAKGMVNAGLIYWKRGDTGKALGLYKRAAELGDRIAQRNLGIAYMEVEPSDLEEAMKWLNLASLQGDAPAQYQLSLCLRKGGDYENAARWSLRAAQGGYVRAMYNVSLYYKFGVGLVQCDRQATEWEQLAIERGYTLSHA